MAALPDTTSAPAVADTSHGDESDELRHLHAVPEDETGTAEPEPVTPLDESDPVHPLAVAIAWLRAAFVPGSGLYADRQPSIAEGVRRARYGGQLSAVGPLRAAAKTHGYVAAANKAVAHTWVWVVDHPARLSVVAVLLALAVAFPTTRHLIAHLLTPFVWAQHALMN